MTWRSPMLPRARVDGFPKPNKCCDYSRQDNIRANSSKEAILVKKLLDKNDIKLKIIKNKKEITKNVQSQARTVRYNLLTDFCKEKKISIILTAHNLEDQVETFFIRLSRGSGLYGLSSMKQISEISKKIHLVRPLLDVKKEKLINIAKVRVTVAGIVLPIIFFMSIRRRYWRWAPQLKDLRGES